MKNWSFGITLVLACIFGLNSTFGEDKSSNKIPLIAQVTQTGSQPPGLAKFTSKHLNQILTSFREVNLKDFHYESPKGVSWPFQEGRLKFTSGLSASWRYYHCAGLRVIKDGSAAKYYLPRHGSEKSAKE